MKKLLFMVVVVALCRMPGWSQIHIGATTGLNATFVLDKGLREDPRYNSTYTYQWAPVGMSFGVNIGRRLGLSLESILSNQGQLYQVVNAAEQIAGKRDISLQYINLPVLLNFKGAGSGRARSNFNFGPQLGLLTKAREVIQFDPGTYTIPNDPNFELPPNATDNGDGTYTLTETYRQEFTKAANDFKNAEFQIAMGFGLDIDLSKHLYLSTQVRVNYSLTDMRNKDVIEAIQNGNASDIFGARANMLVGVQMGLHYMFGSTRSFKGK